MTTPNVKQVVDSLREHRERLFIGWTDVSDATNLEQAALLIERLANDLQDSQCAEQMSADAEKALRAKVEGLERDAIRYRWLRDYKCNSLHLSRDGDHACNYVTAKEWIEEFQPDWFADDPPEEIRLMKDTNTIWTLQIYPRTPIGFNSWNRSTLDAAIDSAIDSAMGDANG